MHSVHTTTTTHTHRAHTQAQYIDASIQTMEDITLTSAYQVYQAQLTTLHEEQHASHQQELHTLRAALSDMERALDASQHRQQALSQQCEALERTLDAVVEEEGGRGDNGEGGVGALRARYEAQMQVGIFVVCVVVEIVLLWSLLLTVSHT